MIKKIILVAFLFNVFSLTSFSEEGKILCICNWAEYIPDDIIKDFEKETGIQVIYDVFDSLESLEAKLISDSGYDIVVPSLWPMFIRCIKSNLFLKLDFSKIPNAKKIDNFFNDIIEEAYEYGIPFLWGMTGIGYDENIVNNIVPVNKRDSWAMLFDPVIMEKLAKHNVYFLDTFSDVFQAAFLYLKIDPASTDPNDWQKVFDLLMSVRKYITAFDSSRQIQNLVDGNASVIHGWSTYVNMARVESKNRKIKFVIPKEGGVMWLDMLAIPIDARHPNNAHKFINFLLRPDIVARVTNGVHAANTVPESITMVDKTLLKDETVFPSKNTRKRLMKEITHKMPFLRLITRAWLKLKKDHKGDNKFINKYLENKDKK